MSVNGILVPLLGYFVLGHSAANLLAPMESVRGEERILTGDCVSLFVSS